MFLGERSLLSVRGRLSLAVRKSNGIDILWIFSGGFIVINRESNGTVPTTARAEISRTGKR